MKKVLTFWYLPRVGQLHFLVLSTSLKLKKDMINLILKFTILLVVSISWSLLNPMEFVCPIFSSSSQVIAIKDIIRPPKKETFNDVYIVWWINGHRSSPNHSFWPTANWWSLPGLKSNKKLRWDSWQSLFSFAFKWVFMCWSRCSFLSKKISLLLHKIGFFRYTSFAVLLVSAVTWTEIRTLGQCLAPWS